jgi:thioredoxin-related protein
MTHTRKLLFALILFVFCIPAKAQNVEPKELIKWLTFDKAQELNKTQPRPFFIDCYTDWCGWCKYMTKTTFSNPDIASYINGYFYPVRFNAEGFDTITFMGEKYFNKTTQTRSTHDLALKMLEGKLSYPTIVYYNNDFKFKLIAPGYMSSQEIEPYLVYTVEYVFNSLGAQDFAVCYKRAYHPDSTFADTATMKWNSLLKSLE